jgi:hypothetical protein
MSRACELDFNTPPQAKRGACSSMHPQIRATLLGAALVLEKAFASLGLFSGILSGPTNGWWRWAMRECSVVRQVQGAAAAIGAGAAAATGNGAEVVAVAAAMGGMVSATGAGFRPPGRQRRLGNDNGV